MTNGAGRWPAKAHRSFYGRGGAATRPAAPARTAEAPETIPVTGLLSNSFLGSLPPEDFERLAPSLEPVTLSARENFSNSEEARHVYFPEDAVVSHLVVFEDGGTVEAAMTGRDGVVGLGAVFGHFTPTHWSRVTIPGSALRMRADLFRQEFAAGEAFRRLLLKYAARYSAQVAQRGACVSRHRVENRLAVWLLMLHDRAGSDQLPLTQELIARRIGTRRAGISEFAGSFQERGLITYSRGHLRVRDREGLEAVACECYRLIRDHG